MRFDLRRFLRFPFLVLATCRGRRPWFVVKLVAWLFFVYAIYPLIELGAWVGFLLDDVLYRGYRQQSVSEPVFIIGAPRSGTTFLQRLLAQDGVRFTSITLGEILLAPSVTQRKVWQVLAALDDRIGCPGRKLIAGIERRLYEKNVAHGLGLFKPEEDEYLHFHLWSTFVLWTYPGLWEEARPFVRFDEEMPEGRQRRMMSFYVRCVQRHLYAHGASGDVHYLAKNPSYSGRVAALREAFPDARFVYLVRNPLKTVPSLVSLMDFSWRILGGPVGEPEAHQALANMVRYWYDYPLEWIGRQVDNQAIVVRYEDLLADVGSTVKEVYETFGLDIGPQFAAVLAEETRQARAYTSDHHYSLSDVNVPQGDLLEQFSEVFDRFGFDVGEAEEKLPSKTDEKQQQVARGSRSRARKRKLTPSAASRRGPGSKI